MIGAVKAVGVFKVRAFQTQSVGLVIHQLDKAFHRAAAVNGQRHRHIVAGAEHQTVQQLLHRQNFPFPQVHGGAFDAHRLFRDPHPVQHITLLADDQCRHDLGGAGDKAAAVGILFIQHTLCFRVPKDGFLRGDRLRRQR